MIDVKLKADFSAVMKMFEDQQKQVRFAAAVALTEVAKAVQAAEYGEMKTVFDRPNPFTLRSLYLDRATPQKLKATVWLKDDFTGGMNAGHYLLPQIRGGTRIAKAFERALARIGVLPAGMVAVPASGAKLDNYGNMSRGQIVQILSYFEAFGEQGYTANITPERRRRLAKGTKKRLGTAYFVPRDGRLALGIWQRFHFVQGSAIKPVLLFYSHVGYRAIYRFAEVGNATIEREWPGQFKAALTAAFATARA